ncbi:MAG: VPLPA-CTERM sorting domain-containing protein [Nitrospira sp.]|nr:VPLPA-CTERM sorting domain-containing protein [Nitrospira sp.]MCP9442295.1 VPLPA-CTERM sorting domain-containing protein [Nitrospira sp.]
MTARRRTLVGVFVGCGLWASTLFPVGAATLTFDGTIYRTAGGTTFDLWHITMLERGSFTVDVLAYEASQSNTTAAGYFAADLNGDGELTWLDADTYFYRATGEPLRAVDALVRADDINNNTPVYQNGLTADTSPVTLISLSQAEGATDGSIHFRRDPAFVVTMEPGHYLFLVADYRLDPTEAEAGINLNDRFSPPTGFDNPITTHADYRLTFKSDVHTFSVNGNSITIAPVPLPASLWLFGSGLIAGMRAIRRTGRTSDPSRPSGRGTDDGHRFLNRSALSL